MLGCQTTGSPEVPSKPLPMGFCDLQKPLLDHFFSEIETIYQTVPAPFFPWQQTCNIAPARQLHCNILLKLCVSKTVESSPCNVTQALHLEGVRLWPSISSQMVLSDFILTLQSRSGIQVSDAVSVNHDCQPTLALSFFLFFFLSCSLMFNHSM